ncbi:MAG: hypothetical protein Ct9H90mP14_4120 [Methanobacteriota archaeon]|nr:MAG: hypothetical protein Ct9H90mP14_4120 [Euryarchaeota archaeon]
MLVDGEFDIRTDEAGIEVWVTQMGDFKEYEYSMD